MINRTLAMHVLTNEIEQLALPAELANRNSALTIGSFDGIHLGHQRLVRDLVARAHEQGLSSGLVTFYPHPATVLYPQRPTHYLTTPAEKSALLEPLGLDWIAILPFSTRLAAMPPRHFVRHLVQQLNMRSLWVGQDFALGQGRRGNLATLRHLGDEFGFQVCEIPFIDYEGTRISSTHIRTLLQHGHVQEAARFLGRPYSVFGQVVHGAQRGRCLGFPTANVDAPADRVVPANGIYAAYSLVRTSRYASVVYIGGRPSFDYGARSIEAHLLDFEGDIYGCDLVIEFIARLRGDHRFPDVKDLITQINKDIEQARQLLDPRRESLPDLLHPALQSPCPPQDRSREAELNAWT
jgi:riboflavin kinase/FMN adenylyltransferase